MPPEERVPQGEGVPPTEPQSARSSPVFYRFYVNEYLCVPAIIPAGQGDDGAPSTPNEKLGALRIVELSFPQAAKQDQGKDGTDPPPRRKVKATLEKSQFVS